MINDLLTYLTLEHIERLTDPTLPREQADLERQLFETLLAGGPEEDKHFGPAASEDRLLRDYLRLEPFDFNSLNPEVHAWYLERICAAPDLASSEDAPRLATTYFLPGSGFLRFLAVGALLTTDEQKLKQDETRTQIARIWNSILADEGLNPEQKATLLDELADILVDYNSKIADRALRQLARAAREFPGAVREFLPVTRRLLDRAEQLGGEEGARLRRILNDAGNTLQ